MKDHSERLAAYVAPGDFSSLSHISIPVLFPSDLCSNNGGRDQDAISALHQTSILNPQSWNPCALSCINEELLDLDIATHKLKHHECTASTALIRSVISGQPFLQSFNWRRGECEIGCDCQRPWWRQSSESLAKMEARFCVAGSGDRGNSQVL